LYFLTCFTFSSTQTHAAQLLEKVEIKKQLQYEEALQKKKEFESIKPTRAPKKGKGEVDSDDDLDIDNNNVCRIDMDDGGWGHDGERIDDIVSYFDLGAAENRAFDLQRPRRKQRRNDMFVDPEMVNSSFYQMMNEQPDARRKGKGRREGGRMVYGGMGMKRSARVEPELDGHRPTPTRYFY
jgi:hypothetical protein